MAGALAFCAASKQGKEQEMNRLLWDKGFKEKKMDMSDVGPPAEAGGQQQAAEKSGAQPAQAQKCWDTPGGCANTVAFAQEIQLDVNKFKADMKGECQQLIQKDMRDLTQLGVGSTPTFFINGRYMVGAAPTEAFATLIDEELKKANERIAAGTPAASYYQQWVIDKGLKQLEKLAERPPQ